MRSISSTQSPLISVTRKWPLRIGNAPLGLPNRRGGSWRHEPVCRALRRYVRPRGITRRRQFLMSARSTSPLVSTDASSGFQSWLGPEP